MPKKKREPPSRLKYERSHPTFSFRIYEELSNRLEAVKKAEGVSNTNIVEAGVGLFEVKRREEKEIRDEAYEEGWEKGAAEAEELYSVSCPCCVCGKETVVTTEGEKKTIRRDMREHGWGHGECVNPRC